MAWPTLDRYQSVLQNPHICFRDSELKQATFLRVSKVMPVPKLLSGSLAIVAFMQGPTRKVLRFFAQEQPERRERYGVISKFLQTNRSPYFADFTYISEGILVDGTWYPLLQMELMTGCLLRRYISERVDKGDTQARRELSEVVERFETLLADLGKLGIAHGDLHDENIFVESDGTLRLVDYDGMFVPELRGRTSLELGRPNYQHPNRQATDYDATLDRFSGLLMSVGLRALSEKPDLWQHYDNGQNLLFTRADLLAPSGSAVIRDLKSLTERRTRELLSDLLDWARRANHFPAPQMALGNPQVAALQEFQRRVQERRWRDAQAIWRTHQLDNDPAAASEKTTLRLVEVQVRLENARAAFVQAYAAGNEGEALRIWDGEDMEKDPESSMHRDKVALIRRKSAEDIRAIQKRNAAVYIGRFAAGAPDRELVEIWESLKLDQNPEAAMYLPSYQNARRALDNKVKVSKSKSTRGKGKS